MVDEFTGPEIGRRLEAIDKRLDQIFDKLENLSTTFTPREVHNLDIEALSERIAMVNELTKANTAAIAAARADADARAKWANRTFISLFVLPLVLLIIASVLGHVSWVVSS